MNCTAHFSRSPINVGKDDWTFTAHLPGLSSPHIIFLFNCDVDTVCICSTKTDWQRLNRRRRETSPPKITSATCPPASSGDTL